MTSLTAGQALELSKLFERLTAVRALHEDLAAKPNHAISVDVNGAKIFSPSLMRVLGYEFNVGEDIIYGLREAFMNTLRVVGQDLRARITVLGGDPGEPIGQDDLAKASEMYVIYEGDLGCGFRLFGPYGSDEEASNTADSMNLPSGNVMRVEQPPKRD